MMKLGIVGSGMIVQDFLSITNDLPDIELVALIGRESSIEKMTELKNSYKIGTIYTDFDQALADPQIDTIYVAVPNDLHYVFSKEALLAKKHVICEKPFTLSLEQLIELENLALQNQVILVEAITNQYLPNYEAIKHELKTIGAIKIVECNYSQYSSRYDKFQKGVVLPAFDPKKGGGALMDINIYNIHFVVGLFGKPLGVKYLANVEKNIDTSGILLMDYGEMKISCIGAKDSSASVRSVIQGTKGSLTVEGGTNRLANYCLQFNQGALQTHNKNSHPHRMYNEFQVFIQMIGSKDFSLAKKKMEHSKQVMEVVDLALADAGLSLG